MTLSIVEIDLKYSFIAVQCSTPAAITKATLWIDMPSFCRSELYQPASGGTGRSCDRGQCPGVALA